MPLFDEHVVPPAVLSPSAINKQTVASHDDAKGCVLELDTNTVDTPDSNRAITLESLSGLMESMRAYGQFVIGIVAKNPDNPARWLCLDGNRRLMVSRLLGRKFKAVEHEGKVTPGSLAATRIAANRNRKQLSDDELAFDLEKIMEEEGCTQAQAAKKCGLSSSEANKCLKFQQRAIPEVKKAVADKVIVRDVARAISMNPVEQQKELLERAKNLNMCSDAVEALASQMRGKKPQKKGVKVVLQGITVIIGIEDLQKVFAVLALLDSALRKLEKHALPLAALPSLVRS